MKDNLFEKQKAAQKAEAELKSKGLSFPTYDFNKSPSQNYDAMRTYSILEAELIVSILKANNTPLPRPLAINTVKPRKDYGNSYYD